MSGIVEYSVVINKIKVVYPYVSVHTYHKFLIQNNYYDLHSKKSHHIS